MKTKQAGFTLIEMMVVIAVIAILAASLGIGYNRMTKNAQRAKAVEAVSNAQTALVILHDRADGWPKAILNASTHDQGYHVMDEDVAKVMFKYSLLGVDCKGDRSEPISTYKLRGVDRCGIVDPWAQDALQRADKNQPGSALLSRSVSSGGTVQDHLIYFAVDQDEDGFVTKTEGAPVNKVRAMAIAWCAGADGGLGDCSTAKPTKGSANGRVISNSDNVYSWNRDQEVK